MASGPGTRDLRSADKTASEPRGPVGSPGHDAVARTQEDAVARVNRPTTKRHVSKRVRSPVGTLTLVASDEGLAAILWEHDRAGRARLNIEAEDKRHPVLLEAERQLKEYFAGRRTRFTLPLDLSGTPFQQQVWRALLTIPFGETRSYAQIARQIGKPGAARAVGAANGRNPVSIVAPCHRVIGATGGLTGYGGGLDVKARLLALEGAGSTS
jgi:methylated-DNA-[protein]-cysteine S-methyltransferase